MTFAFAFGRTSYTEEAASFCFLGEVLPDLPVVGEDGDQIVLVEHITSQPVFGDVDRIVVFEVVNEIEEVFIFVLVGSVQ